MNNLTKIIEAANASSQKLINTLFDMYKSGELKAALPELYGIWSKGEELAQDKEHHPEGNVIKHILATIYAVDDVIKNKQLLTDENKLRILRIVALFHDLGKLYTKSFNEKKNKIQYIGHAEKSVEIFKKYMNNIENANIIEMLIANHMKFIPDMSTKTYMKIKSTLSNNFELLKLFQVVDTVSAQYTVTINNNAIKIVNTRNLADKIIADYNKSLQQFEQQNAAANFASELKQYLKKEGITDFIRNEIGAQGPKIGEYQAKAKAYIEQYYKQHNSFPSADEVKQHLKNDTVTETVIKIVLKNYTRANM